MAGGNATSERVVVEEDDDNDTYPHGLNYSTGAKIGRGFFNLVVGLGSFTMGDWLGGLIVGGGEIAGLVFLIVGATPEESEDEYGVVTTSYPNESLMYVGMGVGVAAWAFGFVRPFLYDISKAKKNGTYYAGNPMDHINIAVVPDKRGKAAVNMSYSFQF
jgi:hypothetical protein